MSWLFVLKKLLLTAKNQFQNRWKQVEISYFCYVFTFFLVSKGFVELNCLRQLTPQWIFVHFLNFSLCVFFFVYLSIIWLVALAVEPSCLLLDFCPKILGRWFRPRNYTLSFCKCRLSGGKHSNPSCCNRTHYNFLNSQLAAMLKYPSHACKEKTGKKSAESYL